MTPRDSLRLVIGPDRKLRMLWRAVSFFVLAYWVLPLPLDRAFGFLSDRLHLGTGLTAANVATNELENFVVALICTPIFALYEHRRVDSYGLPVAYALGARTAEGAFAGIVMAGRSRGGNVFPGRHADSRSREPRNGARAVSARLAVRVGLDLYLVALPRQCAHVAW